MSYSRWCTDMTPALVVQTSLYVQDQISDNQHRHTGVDSSSICHPTSLCGICTFRELIKDMKVPLAFDLTNYTTLLRKTYHQCQLIADYTNAVAHLL
jgi:hypothetical protein